MVTFSIPAYGEVETSLILPDPQLNDSHSYTKIISVHVSRNKKIRSINFLADSTKRVILKELVFHINLNKMKEMKVFFETAKGEYIKYTDYNSVEWICLINTDIIDYSSIGTSRSVCDDRDSLFEVSLVLEAWIDGQGTKENPDEIPDA